MEAAIKRHEGEERHTGGFVVVGTIFGVGSKKEFYESVEKSATKGIKVIRREAAIVKRPDMKIKDHDYFSYGGYVYLMRPLADLDLIGPVVSLSILEYELDKQSYDVDGEYFSWAFKTDEEKAFFNTKECHTLFLDDNNGNCLVIASCGSIEGNVKFVPERKIDYTLEQFMVKTSDPFGDF